MYKKENVKNVFGEFVWWFGVVEDRNDPLFLGRCRVRILGYHDSHESGNSESGPKIISTENLPWAHPIQPITSAAMNGIGTTPLGPVEGSWVMGFFKDGKNAQQPMMMGTFGGIPTDKTLEGLEGYDPKVDFHDPRTDKLAEDGNDDNKGTQNLNTAPVRVTDYNITSMSANVRGPLKKSEGDDFVVEEENSTNYPRQDGKVYYAETEEPDTNRLAHDPQGEITIADLKLSNVQTNNTVAIPDTAPVDKVKNIAGSGSENKRAQLDGTSLNQLDNDKSKTKQIISRTDFQKPNDGVGIFPHATGTLNSSTVESKTTTAWNEPETPINSVYPYNHVYESESGHYVEYDDTKGAERIHQYHRSGTFEEIHPDGTTVHKIVGKNYTIICEDNHVRIAGDTHITVDRGMKLLINNAQYERGKLDSDDVCENDLDIEIAQGSNVNINLKKGNINCKIQEGDINTHLVKGNIYSVLDSGQISLTLDEGDCHTWLKKGNVNLKLDNGHIETVIKKGDSKTHIDNGSAKIEINQGNLVSQLRNGNASLDVTGNAYVKTTGKIGLLADGDIDIKSGASIHLNAALITGTASQIHWNSPGMQSNDPGLAVEGFQFKEQKIFNNGQTSSNDSLGVIS
jgi:hypothetical protein